MSPDVIHYYGLLFDLTKPVIMSPEMFDQVWPYVDSVYTKLQQELLQQNSTVRFQKYECRLRNSKKPGTYTSDSKMLKRWHSSIGDQYLCDVRIKVSRTIDASNIVIERIDDHTHTHDIEESFQIKKPSILVNSIKAEVVKNYSAFQIFHALRGAGTAEGSERLKSIEGSFLTRRGMKNLKCDILTDKCSLSHVISFDDDVLQARSLLTERGWLFEGL